MLLKGPPAIASLPKSWSFFQLNNHEQDLATGGLKDIEMPHKPFVKRQDTVYLADKVCY